MSVYRTNGPLVLKYSQNDSPLYLQVEDSVFDIIAEDFIENQVIIPDLDELIPEVATEVLSHYDTKVMRRELKEVV